MERSSHFTTLGRGAAIIALVFGAAACTVSEQEPPALSGPSGFGLSLVVTAAPQVLARDGSSMSTISVLARNADGSPFAGRRLLLSATAGTLVTSEVLTANDGRANVIYVAPGLNEPISSVRIDVTPVEAGDRANTHSTSLVLEVRGPDVPVADFVFDPTDAAVQDMVSFDASGSTLGGAPCGSACTYAWNFDDGSSGTGLGVSHAFGSARVFNVTLTVTALGAGTSATVTRPVRIAIPPVPEAELTASPSSPTAGQTIIFSSTSVVAPGVTIVRHVWNLDNGAPAVDTGSTPSYTLVGGYAAGTTHEVTLTITDNYGRTSRSEPRTIEIP
jgi:PKD repeat protein